MVFTKENVMSEAAFLEAADDCVGFVLPEDKGLFVQVVDYGEGKEYLIELNKIDELGGWEPCASYNASSPFGDTEKLWVSIMDYLKEVY